MRILLCHNYYREPGGEDQVFADEAWLLESRGHEVIRYIRHNDDIASLSGLQAARATLWNPATRRAVGDLIREHRPDLLHSHNTFPLISPSLYAAARDAGLPLVQTLHNYRWLCPSGLMLRDGRPCEDCVRKLVAWPGVLHRCYRGNRAATAVVAAMLAFHRLRGTMNRDVPQCIALSEFSRRKFVQGGLPAERIAVKTNFLRQDPPCGHGTGGFAIFVGRLAAEKGIATLLAAWRQMQAPLPLRIVGDGPLGEPVRAASAADLRVQWLGRRPSAEVLDLVGDAACLVLPSICYENCPKTVIEAFAKGTPVVASRLGAMQEMVDHGRTGLLFEPGNAADLARSLDEAIATGRLREMRHAARQAFEEKYTPEANYEQLMEIYRRNCHSLREGSASFAEPDHPRSGSATAPAVAASPRS